MSCSQQCNSQYTNRSTCFHDVTNTFSNLISIICQIFLFASFTFESQLSQRFYKHVKNFGDVTE